MVTEVKVCGLTSVDDAMAALDCGADCLGFVLYAGSPRHVKPESLPDLVGALPPGRAVAVVVNMDPGVIEWLAARCALRAVQFHGDEAPAAARRLAVDFWRAVSFRGGAWAPDPAAWNGAERLVVDASDPKRYGGSGELADWSAAAKLAAERKVMLAGGLTPSNVAAAVRAVRPVGVDVSSGVESAPGRKDRAAVRRFIEEVRKVEAEHANEV
jgi:phosphoribosylanthranilate isomerase